MRVRWIALPVCLLVAGGVTSVRAASPGGHPEAGPATRPEIRPGPDLPRPQPPVAPELEDGAVAAPEPPREEEHPAVLVQGYVKTATSERLVLSAPGTTETLSLSVDDGTRVLSSEADLGVEDLKPGQLVRAALVPSGEDLVAVVVEVMPDSPVSPGQ